eukprot:CAMPEP_0185574880 /NCGR_PEP_ID=MMETSP0434-20130131/6230_1 /TAXON_ID=626734 ORGANISM="Favella taraikaensis, Strain Fe Narragansett Bay" /NCGR_SAMPLE_ID=MMETSP0434 /ASSEMBLY_ACC=CAM_ASM_000379 /LENGTH=96 /DNA_ID=CAMNT_0028191593 /DNA_START=942 /DNA_END=1232 /DNA_ORIENTATION=+
MESMDESLTREDFCSAAANLYQTLGPIEKSAVLNFKKDGVSLEEKHKNRDQTHRPKIDSNSQQIMQQSEMKNMEVVERLMRADQQKQENLRMKQIE